jgi:hypothetical protein
MSTNFPSSLDTLTNPISTDPVTNPSHASQHANANDAIEALEAKVGVDSSAVTTSLDYKLKSTSSTDPGHKHTPTTSLVISGTPDGTKFLRDDNTWAVPAGGGDVAGPGVSVDSEIVLFNGTGGDTLKRASTTGILKATSGVLSAAVSGTDYALPKFGGDGSDGALNTTSSSVSINLTAEKCVIKNYTSITVATNNLTFTNPHTTGSVIILKSQGNVTISSVVSVDSMGAAGGAAASTAGGTSLDGNVGSSGASFIWKTNAGGAAATNAVGAGGAATTDVNYVNPLTGSYKYYFALVGSGGGSGSVYSGASGGSADSSGAGGRGGGCLIIECGGTLTFTGTISADGGAGDNAVSSGASLRGAAGGGGGSGGFILVLANAIGTNSGTLSVVGGTGGNAASGGSASASYGGGGGGFGSNAGDNGTSGTSGKTGGDGADGASLVSVNKDFV